MNFVEFIKIAKPIINKLSDDEIKNSLVFHKKIRKNKLASRDHLVFQSIKTCYDLIFKKIFTNHQSRHAMNEYFLDWSTETQNYSEPSIWVNTVQGSYCFLPEEIINIFHSDLNRSNVDYEPNYKIYTLTKSFRLPQNPYSNLRFTTDEIRQILSQLFLIHNDISEIFPELYSFFLNAEQILYDVENKSNYLITSYLDDFFSSQGLIFKENYKFNQISKQIDNYSTWSFKKTKNKQKGDFIQSLFTLFFAHLN
jgi:hypothetical protein